MAKDFLDLLDSLAKRPQMYVHPVSFATVQSFLHGLNVGCRLAGIDYSWDDYFAAAQDRGWDPRGNIGIERDFRNKGIPDEVMAQELIAVAADAYRRALVRLKGPSAEQQENGPAARIKRRRK
jgi:hypothetical protein